MTTRSLLRSLVLALGLLGLDASAQIGPSVPAFPGAEGFGAAARGGRGGTPLYVTNTDDSGPGSLRWALLEPYPRTVLFAVSGTIALQSQLQIDSPFVTVAGQTAPGGGIAIRNAGPVTTALVKVTTNDVVLRHLRFRPGPDDSNCGSANLDALLIDTPDSYRVIVDHCSVSWAVDENMSIFGGARDVTVQWCLISEGLYCSNHEKTVEKVGCDDEPDPSGWCYDPVDAPDLHNPHSRGMTISTLPDSSDNPDRISLHHNLWAHNDQRHPNVTSSTFVDFVNNVVYDFKSFSAKLAHKNTHSTIRMNYEANVFLPGPSTPPDQTHYVLTIDAPDPTSSTQVYYADNIAVDPVTTDLPNGYKQYIVGTPFQAPAVTMHSPFILPLVLGAGAGATLPARDAVDARVVQEVLGGAGGEVNDPSETGGWPDLKSLIAPLDTDKDGMPDDWEDIHGFEKNKPGDGPQDRDQDGYTNLEEYLNGTTP
ncbi:MAG: hypothetical protein AAF682_08075 [Planctomycetota bacterium]